MDGLLRKNKTRISLHSLERLFDKNLSNKTTLSIWENRYEKLKVIFMMRLFKLIHLKMILMIWKFEMDILL
jgi:hypothetical protein